MKILTVGIIALIFVIAACGGTSDATSPLVPTSEPTKLVESDPSNEKQTQSGQATLEIRVTDAPPEGVSKIEITVASGDVNKSKGPSPVGWETVISQQQTFDLVQLIGVEAILGSAQLDPGSYHQIRLEVIEAKITIDGKEMIATVPSGRLRLVGTFELSADETTLVTLDFDAEKSAVLRGNNSPLLKPVVKLLVRRSDEPFTAAVPAPLPGGPAPSEGTSEPLSSNSVRVFVPSADNLQFMSFWVALGAGLFEDEGLDIRVVLPPRPGGGSQFLFEGIADVALYPPPQIFGPDSATTALAHIRKPATKRPSEPGS